MSVVRTGIDRLAGLCRAGRATAYELGRAGGEYALACAAPAGLRGLAVEWAWLAVHLAYYPAGLLAEELDAAPYRTDPLRPGHRGLLVTDLAAAGTPIVLVHGILDNRSVFTVLRRTLRRRGFGSVHAVNYSFWTGDVRAAAHQLGRHVDAVREQTGAERVHVVGHSLGGLIARYHVQRMGGSAAVDTLVTLGTPHGGTRTAHLLPTPLARQLRPGSTLLEELARPAPGCRTRFLVVWSRLDQMIVPQCNARLVHPDLAVEHLELRDVGHFALPIDARALHWVATRLARPLGEVCGSGTTGPDRVTGRRR